MTSQEKTPIVRSLKEEMDRFINAVTDAAKQRNGQKPPASESQIVLLNLRNWPMASPKMHGMIPNIATVIMAFRRFGGLPILCLSENVREPIRIEFPFDTEIR